MRAVRVPVHKKRGGSSSHPKSQPHRRLIARKSQQLACPIVTWTCRIRRRAMWAPLASLIKQSRKKTEHRESRLCIRGFLGRWTRSWCLMTVSMHLMVVCGYKTLSFRFNHKEELSRPSKWKDQDVRHWSKDRTANFAVAMYQIQWGPHQA